MSTAARALNISELIDTAKLSRLQLVTLGLCALVMAVDGMDTQSIGIAAPLMAKDLGLQMSSFGFVFSAALLGAAVGALIFGTLGDHFGRKKVLLVATLTFAVFTIVTALTTSYEALVIARFLAGLGLGGAVPNVVSLNSEYAPKRIYAFMVTVQWSAFPLGGTFGGFIARYLIGTFGWKSVFYFGGTVAVLIIVLLLLYLPESLRFLIAKNAAEDDVRSIVEQISPGTAPAGTRFTSEEEHAERSILQQLVDLFTEGRAMTTILIWIVFAINFMILVFTPLWAPSLLVRDSGISPENAAVIVALNNFGSMIGGVLAGRLIDKFGPYGVLVPTLTFGTIFTALIGVAGIPFAGLAMIDSLAGFFMGAGGNGAVAVCAAAYPTRIRATGMGWAVTMARLGQVGGSLLAGALIAIEWKADSIFLVIGTTALISAGCVLGLRRSRPTLH